MAFRVLNGWRRLWIVVAVVTLAWAVLHAFGKAANSGSADYDVIIALEDPACDYVRTLPEGFELDREPEYGSACYDLYMESKYSDTPLRSVEEYRAEMAARYRQSLLAWLTTSLVIWAVGIALIYGAGAAAAWVRRGFQGGASGAP